MKKKLIKIETNISFLKQSNKYNLKKQQIW